MLRSWTTALAAAVLLASATTASAATVGPVEVLPALGEELPVSASIAGSRVCFGELPSRSPDTGLETGLDDDCGDPLARDDRAAVTETTGSSESGAGSLVGAVPATASRVRVAFPGGQRIEAPTVPAPAALGPRGARLAFFRVRIPDVDRPPGFLDDSVVTPTWLQALDASGAVVGVMPRLAEFDDDRVGPRVGPTRVVVTSRRRAGTTRAVSYAQEVLAPTAARLARTELQACLGVSGSGRGGAGSGGEDCYSPADLLAIGPRTDLVLPSERCEAGAVAVEGPLPAGTTAASAVLGDGRRVRVPLVDLSRALPGRVGVLYVPPAGAAVRRLDLTGPVRTIPLRAAPATVTCAGRERDGFSYFAFLAGGRTALGPPAALAGPEGVLTGTGRDALLAADGPEGTLCLAVGRPLLRGGDCGVLSRAPGAVLLAAGPLASGTRRLAGVVGPRGATVELVLARGTRDGTPVRRRVRLATAAAPPGPSGALRTFATTARVGEQPIDVVVRSSSGRRLATDDLDEGLSVVGDGAVYADPPEALRARRLGRVRDLTAWRVVVPRLGPSEPCSALTDGRRPEEDDLDCASASSPLASVTVAASCASRRLVLTATTGRGDGPLAAVASDGRSLPTRRFALGAGTHLDVVLAPGGVRSIATAPGGRARDIAVPVPAPREQCGYAGSVLVSSPPEELGGR